MLLYHGTSKMFEKFQVGEEFLDRDISFLAEGLGIYMTQEIEVASAYGGHLIEVEFDTARLLDLTNKKEVAQLIKMLDAKVEGLISKYLSPSKRTSVINSIVKGLISASKLGREFDLLIDCNESYHVSGDADKELSVQEFYDEILQEKVIRYYEEGMGRFVFLAKNPNILSIVSRQNFKDLEKRESGHGQTTTH